jgi:FkbM family methyltransferase
VYLRNGLAIELRGGVSDFQIVDEIFIHQVYQRALGRIHRGSMVIDIGAQCGIFTLAAASRGARVMAYEPLPENYKLLVANAHRNGFAGTVSTNKLAVTGKTGETDFYIVPEDTGGGTVYPEGVHGWSLNHPDLRHLQVACLSLDDLFRENQLRGCDLLKLDCEGSEYDILSATSRETLAAVDAIILEYHPNVSLEGLNGLLCTAGFRIERCAQWSLLFAWRERRE